MALVDDLVEKGALKNPNLIRAFRAVDRWDFVPEPMKDFAYVDEPLAIGEGQTISQPWTVAFMLELLSPSPGDNIMEVGYGSGWQTALLAYVGANVYAVERIPKLCEWGKRNVEKCGFRGVKFFCQDGTMGLPDIAKRVGGFDKIIAAASGRELPPAWKNQLKTGGKIIAPIGHSIFEFTKRTKAAFDAFPHHSFAFVNSKML